ncbi:MAG TPA: GGDEF domain-containing protein [Kineosporiaceae bacterium]|nr:GGDEF domain-containing protein [Kineosporiaceae bacterium]
MRGWPDDGTGAEVPEADVEALVAWGRFTDAAPALERLEQALPALERGPDARALLLALHGRALLIRLVGRPAAEVVEAADVLERAALERRAPVWVATASAVRARARLDAGEVGSAMNDLARVHLDQLGPALGERAGLLLLDTLAGAYARLRLDERVDEVRGVLETGLGAALPLDRAVHWAAWSTELAARALDPLASGRGEPDQALLERALAASARLDELPRSAVPDRVRRAVQGVRALAAAYRGRASEALRLLGEDAFGEPKDLPPLERQIATLAAIHAHALVGSVATARSLDDAATPAPGSLPHLVLDACRARERLWLETHAGGSVVHVLTRLDDVLARIGWLGMDLVAQTAGQVLEHQALRVESRTDPLTGVGNRRALDEELRRMLRFTPMPLALVLVDIDDFKQVNDAFTHVVGDEVLRRVAACLGRELRVGDHLARYGGDEFIALLPRTGDQEARQVAQRMAEAIARLPWFELADALAVGISTGSAALWSLTGRRPDRDAENLFRRADEALLDAKRRRAQGMAPAPDWAPSGSSDWSPQGRRRRAVPGEQERDLLDESAGYPASGQFGRPGPPDRGQAADEPGWTGSGSLRLDAGFEAGFEAGFGTGLDARPDPRAGTYADPGLQPINGVHRTGGTPAIGHRLHDAHDVDGYDGPGVDGYDGPGVDGYDAPGVDGYDAPGVDGYDAPGVNGHQDAGQGAPTGGWAEPATWDGPDLRPPGLPGGHLRRHPPVIDLGTTSNARRPPD